MKKFNKEDKQNILMGVIFVVIVFAILGFTTNSIINGKIAYPLIGWMY